MDRLRVRLLGGLEVEAVDLSRLRSRKARTLLKVLALARCAPVSAAVLAEAIWPEGPPERPAEQMSVLVSRARQSVGPQRLRRTDAGYLLHVDWLDVDALTGLVAEARRRRDGGRPGPARAAAVAALDLVRGPLLPDEPDASWIEADRTRVEQAVAEARVVAAEAALALGDVWESVSLAQQGLTANPYDEAALRVLMRGHVAAGRPALALSAYAQAAALLADDLGADPAPETAEVHLAVLRNDLTVTAPRPLADMVAPGLVGRDRELDVLDRALAAAVRGDLQFVVIEGEPGIGKSALLDAWVRRAARDGVTVLRSAGHQFGGGFPLDLVLTAVEDHLRGLAPVQAEQTLGEAGEVLAPLLGGVAAAHGAADLATAMLGDPSSGQAMLFSALDSVMARLGAAAPVVLALDDAHLADQASVAWLHHCAGRLAHHRVLLLVAHRLGEGPAYVGTARIALGPLDVEAAAELVGPARAPDLHARADGNPLFLLELGRTEVEDLPASIREMVAARCDRAGPAGSTVRAAAVLGTEIDLDLLAQVLPTPAAELLDHLEDAVRRRLLSERPSGLVFAHGLVREALVATTSPPRRTHLHREAARALAGRARPDPLRVAHHARAGGDLPLAAQALAEAAAVASDRFDHPEALRLLDEAVALDDSAALRVRRARARISAGRYSEAAADAAVATAAGEGADALEAAAQAAYHVRDFPKALRLADDGARLATGDQERAACGALAGRVQIAVGELVDAERRLTAAQRFATGHVRPVADLCLAMLHNQRGDGAAALSLLADEHAVGSTRQPFAVVHRHLQVAHALALVGRPADALAELDRFREAVRRQEASRFAGRWSNFRAWILRNLGDVAEADACNEQGLDEARRAGLGEPETHALLDLADSSMRVGDLDGAARLLQAARRGWDAAPALHWRHEIRYHLIAGGVALSAGDPQAALAHALPVADVARRLETRRYGVFAALLAARARNAAGEPVPPHEIADQVAALERVAPLEAWALTALVAREFGVDAWARLAGERASRLADAAGPWAQTVRRTAGHVLEGLPG